MLMVTTTVRMVDGIHGNTTGLRPAVALDGELVLGSRCLQQRLVCSSSTSNDTNHASRTALHDLLGSTGKLNSRLALIRIVSNDSNVVARRSSQSASIANLLFDIGHDSSFRDGSEGKDVANSQGRVLASVDKLASVHALIGDEGLGDIFEFVRVLEGDFGKRCASTRVVNYVLHNASDVSMAFSIIESTELSRSFVETSMGREN